MPNAEWDLPRHKDMDVMRVPFHLQRHKLQWHFLLEPLPQQLVYLLL